MRDVIDVKLFWLACSRIRSMLLSDEQVDLQDDRLKLHCAADVWRVFYVNVPLADGSPFPEWITPALVDTWGITADDVVTMADVNDRREGFTIRPLSAIASDTANISKSLVGHAAYVSSTSGWFGAAAVLQKAVQEELSDMYPKGYAIAMPNINEAIVIDDVVDNSRMYHTCKEIVEANKNADALSYHIFKVHDGRLRQVI